MHVEAIKNIGHFSLKNKKFVLYVSKLHGTSYKMSAYGQDTFSKVSQVVYGTKVLKTSTCSLTDPKNYIRYSSSYILS